MLLIAAAGLTSSTDYQLMNRTQLLTQFASSETRNRTRVFRVTGGNTDHYTISDTLHPSRNSITDTLNRIAVAFENRFAQVLPISGQILLP